MPDTQWSIVDELECHWPDWGSATRERVLCACNAETAPTWRAFWEHVAGQLEEVGFVQARSNAVPCCDGRLGDDCRCECHVRKSPGAGLVSDQTVQDRTNT